MNMFRKVVIGVLAAAFALGAGASGALAQGAKQATVAILPFTMNVPNDLMYLRDGIRDMLASRISWQGHVEILDRAATDKAVKAGKSGLGESEAVAAGRTLKADYVIFGSVTAMGKAVSLDAKLRPVSGSGAPVNFAAQTRTLDEVAPRITQFAQEVNQKAFGRAPDPGTAVASAPQGAQSESQAFSTKNPDLLIPELMQAGDKISFMNPNFIEITPSAQLRQPGLWRSQIFNEGFLGMDVGDVDGDGRQEIVVVSQSKLAVYKREENGMRLLVTLPADKMDRFVWVSLADLNHDGRDEIYLTSQRVQNLPSDNAGDSINSGLGMQKVAFSYAYEYVNGKLQVLAQGIPYFMNVVTLPRKGRTLLGQQREWGSSFSPTMYEMRLSGRTVQATIPFNAPSRVNIYNFAKADVNNDGADEWMVVDNENRLVVLSSAGDQLWKSSHVFCGTTNGVEGKINDVRYNDIETYFIPSPVLVTDVNKDGIVEVVANRSPVLSILPSIFRYYEKSEIVSLSWDRMGMVENWKTREIGGMLTSLRIGDLTGGGIPQLAASLILSKDILKIWDSKSTIFSYDINVDTTKTAAKAADTNTADTANSGAASKTAKPAKKK